MMNESHTLLTTVVARNLMVTGLLSNFEKWQPNRKGKQKHYRNSKTDELDGVYTDKKVKRKKRRPLYR